ncbi:MAG: helix-turn-helix transcriptional regulator [Synechococcaceae cyanobacterium]|jgi:transcriptional regulator with XRE-family HTH domain|nr:helix-turn-helix transcriptional regulator [Synechococcaceae cyanobacterium]
MTAPPPLARDQRSALAVLLRGLRQRLRWQQRRAASGVDLSGGRRDDRLLIAGQRLQQARLSRGLGLRQLADQTRISTPVLEALERGWRERLPEPAYLRTMLPLLEEHLQLERGSLRDALPPPLPRGRSERRGRAGLGRFLPGSIEVFSSWLGSLFYGGLTLALLWALNRQQLLLAQRGLLSIEPLPTDAIAMPITPPGSIQAGVEANGTAPRRAGAANGTAAGGQGASEALLVAFPELRPLRAAAAGQALAKLRQTQPGPALGLGQLRLQLALPSRLTLTSRGGGSAIGELRGELVLPVLPPFQLRLEPPPTTAEAVRWNGSPLKAGRDGRFRYPPAARP